MKPTYRLSRFLGELFDISYSSIGLMRFLSPFAFSFVFVMTLLYEKPIRHYLNALFGSTSIPQDIKLKARQRLLNEPFALIVLDFSMWVLSAIIWSTHVIGPMILEHRLVQHSLYNGLSIGLITVTVAFFFLEHLLQKRLAPYFFPDGGLSTIPKTLRIRIRTRLVALFFACNLIPLISIILILKRILGSQTRTCPRACKVTFGDHYQCFNFYRGRDLFDYLGESQPEHPFP